MATFPAPPRRPKRTRQRPPVLRGLAWLVLTALAAAALWLGSELAGTLWRARQAQQWQPRPAQLEHWDLVAVGSAGVMPRPGPVAMRELRARYRWRVGGAEFTGQQVALAALRDNVSDRHRDRIAAQLRQAEADGGRLTVWVDPQRPERAVIDRRLPVLACLFQTLLLLLPCGLATLVGVSALAAAAGRPAAALPLWALLHAAPLLAIVWLAEPGDLYGAAAWLAAALGLLPGGVLVAGLVSALRAPRR